MRHTLLACRGGRLALPDPTLVLVDRRDGGNLIVEPPREVWERSELSATELASWSCLVAAAGRAMLDVLPALEGGCINYWEAGNWALNDEAEPVGPKRAPEHRKVHLHLLGRSRGARHPSWRWGESPVFPVYAERLAERFERLSAAECARIVARCALRLGTQYGMPASDIGPWTTCHGCGYPLGAAPGTSEPDLAALCAQCQPQ